jgi:2'-5' RNA ligase
VEACCAENGFEAEPRPYNPHLTLARSRDRRGMPLPSLPPAPELPPWTVAGFRLYQSRLGKGGAAYSVLADFGS